MIKIYTSPSCVFCVKAKKFLEERNIPYTEMDISTNNEARQFLVDSGFRTVPQIFNDDVLIAGGYEGLINAEIETI